ncbi:hypothetical protein PUNSTDRAFT_52679, partial [Punctularia strigosozonata HHB-11173 SS5]|uniref:uncharacterized protein n=1 Tax=Punctularia strigosozonata (strain HHB-11173) TaxID=741275 RepID=UPI00044182CC
MTIFSAHPEPSVVYAVLDAMVDIVKLNTADADNLRGTLAALLRVSFREADKRWLARRALRAACLLKQSPPDPSALLALIHQLKVPKHGLPHCLLLEAYRALHLYPPEALSMVAKDLSPLSPIRPLLTSHDANAQYLFLDCLECLDLGLWAGNGSDESGNSALEPWEMERIMACLDSPDSLIRKKTLGILYRVDRSLVSGYFAQRLSSPRQQDADLNARATGLLELAAILGADDGHAYAQYVIQILEALDDADDVPARHEPENSKGKGQAIVKPQHGPVLEHAVEAVLLKIRDGDSPYQRSSVGALLATLGARDGADPSPTLMVILAALACEYAAAGVQDPREALSGFSIKLDSYRPAVQDACLLAMMRLVLECGDAGPTEDAITAVRTLTVGSGKHIRRRCTQFLDLTSKPEELRKV